MRIVIRATEAPQFALMLRMPGWADSAAVTVNGEVTGVEARPGEYGEIRRAWAAGDAVEIEIPMAARLLEANPFVEETLNQVAIQRGPVVYCLESAVSVHLPGRIGRGLDGFLRIAADFLKKSAWSLIMPGAIAPRGR